MKPYSLHPESIRNLFDNIAPTYDLLNRLLSLGRDLYWRKRAVHELNGCKGWTLDIATGTADVAIELVRQGSDERRVFGLDFSGPMIKRAQEKVLKKKLSRNLCLGLGDARHLPFRENTFSGCVIAFGLRNIIDKGQALLEMVRVVKPGGKVVVLEFTLPQNGLMRWLYPIYFKKVLPWIGGSISGDRSAYAYLPESVSRFRYAKEYEELMIQSGLVHVSTRPLTGGVASIISGMKQER